MRKALVNDIVHSFCYACRQQVREWPHAALGPQIASPSLRSIPPHIFAPFIAYALHCWQGNYIRASRNYTLLATWLRDFSAEEQEYAVTLLERYHYGQYQQYRAAATSRYGTATVNDIVRPSGIECID